jgi:hypothetical protein
MRLESVRELKASLNETIITPMAASPVARAALGMAAQPPLRRWRPRRLERQGADVRQRDRRGPQGAEG